MYCNKCGRKINFGEYSYNGECENCHKGFDSNTQQYTTSSNNNSSSNYGCIAIVVFIIIIFLFANIFSSNNESSSNSSQKKALEKALEKSVTGEEMSPREKSEYDSYKKWEKKYNEEQKWKDYDKQYK